MRLQLSILTWLLFFLPSAFASSRVILDCEVSLGKPEKPYRMQLFASRHTLALRLPGYYDGIIAGNTHSLDMVLRGLRLTAAEFRKKFAGKKVLLVGEGFGELLPALAEIGAKPRAVDPVYALKDVNDRQFRTSLLRDAPNARLVLRNLRGYLEEYDKYLRPAVAQQLPFKDESFDFVISHLLISNLFSPYFLDGQSFHSQRLSIYSAVIHTILESGRVLKPGGEALHVVAGINARPQFLGDNGILSPRYLGRRNLVKHLDFQMTDGLQIDLDYSERMGNMDAIVHRRRISEVSLLTVHRK